MIRAEVATTPFDLGRELGVMAALGGGGVASFLGVVRGDDGLVELLLEHHPGMTVPALRTMAERAAAHWSLDGVTLLHRVGPLGVGEPIVFVATAARHRTAALDACHALIDWLKTEAPFWKRERFADGRTRWVEARAGDTGQAARWAAALRG